MSFFNRQILKENYVIVLAICFVIFCAWLLGQGANYASASELENIKQPNSTLDGCKTASTSIISQTFIPQFYNISSIVIYGIQGLGDASLTLYDQYNNLIGVSTSTSQTHDYGFTFLNPIHVNKNVWYQYEIDFDTIDPAYCISHKTLTDAPNGTYDNWRYFGITGPVSYYTWLIPVQTIYYESTSYDYPVQDNTLVTYLDNETIFSNTLDYHFFEKYCYLEQDIPCELEYSYSPVSLGIEINLTYQNYEDEYGIIATDTPTDSFDYQDSIIVPNPYLHFATSTDESFTAQYCVYSYSTTTLETYQLCGIEINWATDELIERKIAYQGFATAYDDCIGTSTDETNFMSHSLKIFGCWAIYPSASSLLKLYDLKEQAKSTFPLNIIKDLNNRIEYHRINNFLGSSTVSTSTHGIYLFFNGTKSNAKIFGADVIAQGIPQLTVQIRQYLEYFVWFIFVMYIIKKILGLNFIVGRNPIYMKEGLSNRKLNKINKSTDRFQKGY